MERRYLEKSFKIIVNFKIKLSSQNQTVGPFYGGNKGIFKEILFHEDEDKQVYSYTKERPIFNIDDPEFFYRNINSLAEQEKKITYVPIEDVKPKIDK